MGNNAATAITNPMKIFTLLIGLLAVGALHAQRCAANFSYDAAKEAAIQNWIADHRSPLEARTTVTIPVVVHIVWRLPEQQISEAQVLSQIEVLNQDFRALNEDLSQVPEADFQDDIADLEIEFCLAQQTPDGEPTSGITYTQTTLPNVGTTIIGGESVIFYSALGGQDAWDPSRYLNIWVGERAFACGKGIFPNEATPEEDGVIIRYDCFGTTGTATPPYHLGRTTTHEIGHYLNLLHPWGGGNEDLLCIDDDQVEDTPSQAFNYMNQCPVHPQVSCGSRDMFMNFMNLCDDPCLNMFTAGQKERVWAALNLFRPGLLESNGCQAPPVDAVFENPLSNQIRLLNQPARDQLAIKLEHTSLLPLRIRLFQLNGQLLVEEKWEHSDLFSLNCAYLNTGIYFLVVENQTYSWGSNVLVQR